MDVALHPAADADVEVTADDPTAPDAGPRAPRFRRILLVVLVLALVVATATLGWLLAQRRGGAADAQAERDALLRQAEQFVLRLNTYGPDQLDDQGKLTAYRDQVIEVITPKFATDFEQSGLPIAEQTVAQAGYGRTSEIYGSGVEEMDDDSATALVAAGFTGSYPDPKHPKDAAKRTIGDPDVLRWTITLVRSGGEWLVDDYAPVDSGDGTGDAAGTEGDQ